MKKDNFLGRYIIKLSSSIVLVLLNAIIQLFLPRVLSVEEYGQYSYNLNVFTSIVTMLNLSTSNAMIAKFSKRNTEVGILKFYLKYVIISNIILNLGVIFIYLFLKITIFQHQTIIIILLALNMVIFNKVISDIISIYDTLAISRFPAIVQIILKIFICIFIFIGYFLGSLSLSIFYFIQIIITIFSISILYWELYKNHINKYSDLFVKKTKEYIKEFWIFCKPLVLAACCTQFNIIIMNWALINYAGEKEQAMYGIALQLNILLGYIFSPYAELLKREFAIIEDEKILKNIFTKTLKQIFWLISYFALFTLVNADWIIIFLFSESYKGAVSATRIMMIYTIYQALGQIIGSYLLATEQTRIQAIIFFLNSLLSIFFTFLFQIPNKIFQDNIGVIGIVLNYMICNIIITIVSIFYCNIKLKEKTREFFKFQVSVVCECLSIALIIKYIVSTIVKKIEFLDILAGKIIISGLLYTLIILLLFFKFSERVGISKKILKKKIKGVLS